MGRTVTFAPRDAPELVAAVPFAVALAMYHEQTEILFRLTAEHFRPLLLSGLGLQARAVLLPLGQVTGADLGPLLLHTNVDVDAVAAELVSLKRRVPGVEALHLMELVTSQLERYPGLGFVQRLYRMLPT